MVLTCVGWFRIGHKEKVNAGNTSKISSNETDEFCWQLGDSFKSKKNSDMTVSVLVGIDFRGSLRQRSKLLTRHMG